MPEMKSMKLSPKAAKKETATPTEVSAPQYPYGLCLHLDNDTLKKLGLKTLPKAGAGVMIQAKAKVRDVGETDSAEGGKRRNLDLQITDLAINAGKTDPEDVFYPSEE